MKDYNKYNVAFAICPELKQEIENPSPQVSCKDALVAIDKYMVSENVALVFPSQGSIVDTTQLQIASLLMFASRCGFVMQPDFSFRLNYGTAQKSFDYMVKLHNKHQSQHKLVKKVKLQRVKRAKKLVAQSMMVELV